MLSIGRTPRRQKLEKTMGFIVFSWGDSPGRSIRLWRLRRMRDLWRLGHHKPTSNGPRDRLE
jgi:hypothetical protein